MRPAGTSYSSVSVILSTPIVYAFVSAKLSPKARSVRPSMSSFGTRMPRASSRRYFRSVGAPRFELGTSSPPDYARGELPCSVSFGFTTAIAAQSVRRDCAEVVASLVTAGRVTIPE